MTDTYRGRFAPSPTGDLHMGSLVAAVGSYLQAINQEGAWLVRIEDIDPEREVEGASERIVRSLEQHGFEWQGEVQYQSRRIPYFVDIMDSLRQQHLVYPCHCSRRDIAEQFPGAAIYPGTCRDHPDRSKPLRSWRLRTENREITFNDAIQGEQSYSIDTDIGDIVLQRASGEISYQLAVAVDDAESGITQVVRGADLLDSSPRQIYIQQALNMNSPDYAHLPVIYNQQGQKLSKQNLARQLDAQHATQNLWVALDLLGQRPPNEIRQETLAIFWQWAFKNWSIDSVPAAVEATVV